jgi:hypothetical protein
LAASDFGAVLESGKVRLVDTGVGLLDNPEVARLYLGGHAVAIDVMPIDSAPDSAVTADKNVDAAGTAQATS